MLWPTKTSSFDLARRHLDADLLKPGRAKYHDSWFRQDTVDFWRHGRMYDTCAPVAAFYRDAKWLTVGDGRCGLDSVRLRKLFSIHDILATDIAPLLLEKGKQKGPFDSYGRVCRLVEKFSASSPGVLI
jgi:hypothetical protein